jgi:hypothetical protein
MSEETIKSITEESASPQREYALWAQEIEYAQKELDRWHKQGIKCVARYAGDKGLYEDGLGRFNLFGSNVDVLSASLYSTPPEVVVARSFDDFKDDVARVAAIILERCLQQDLQEPNSKITTVLAQTVQDRLVPGMGTCWARIEIEEGTEVDPMTGMPVPIVIEQEVVFDHVHWQDLLWSPCRTWEEKRWVARRVYMSYDAGIKRFGEIFKLVPLSGKKSRRDEGENTNDVKNKLVKEACVWEIWNYGTKEVIWIADGFTQLLDKKHDFLGLKGFYPCPKPFFALLTTSACIPIPDYIRWYDQYKELDLINQRISALTSACRAVGIYDKSQDGVKRLLSEGTENTLIPVDNWAMFAEKGGLKGVIDWLPLDVIVEAQSQLRVAREDVKGQLYELTGISDVVRGESNPHETLGAQKIKANFASSRIQVLQGQLESFVTEVMTIKAELICLHFPEQAILEMSNILNTEDADIANQAVQALKSEQFREYRICIEPYSMAQIDYTEDKADRLELMGTIGTFLEKATVAGQTAPELVPLFATLIQFTLAGFRVSRTIEGAIDKTLAKIVEKQAQAEANPQPPKPSPEEIKAQAEQQKMQFDAQMASANHQAEMQKMQADLQADMAKQQGELAIKQQESQASILIEQQKLALEKEKMQFELVSAQQKHALEMERMKIELTMIQMRNTHETQMGVLDAQVAVMDAESAEKEAEETDDD